MRSTLALALTLALAPSALAGTPEAPELTDPAGDCAVPYGNAYLDVVAAWISDESEVGFLVNLQLAAFDPTLAEAAGYAVQFTHQGVQWGVIAQHGAATMGGWAYATGQGTADGVNAESFEEAEGSFADNVVTVLFPKRLFPHEDASDVSLRGFYVASADLRPAIPFFLADDAAGTDTGNGRWITCDEGASDAEYAFAAGQHSTAEAAGGAAAASNATADAAGEADLAPAAVEESTPPGAPAETPLALAVALAGVAVAALAARRRR